MCTEVISTGCGALRPDAASWVGTFLRPCCTPIRFVSGTSGAPSAIVKRLLDLKMSFTKAMDFEHACSSMRLLRAP